MSKEEKNVDLDEKESTDQLNYNEDKEQRFHYFKRGYLYNKFMNSRQKQKSKSPSPTESSSSSVGLDSLPPLSPLNLSGYKANTKRRLLNEKLANNIRGLIPARLQLYEDWELLYSIEQHGISLNTLYHNCNYEYQLQRRKKIKHESGFGQGVVDSMLLNNNKLSHRRPLGYVLVIEDSHHSKFGCYVNENFKLMDQKRYYGNGECFLWKCEKGYEVNLHDSGEVKDTKIESIRFKAFPYTGVNDNIIYSNRDFIAIGSSDGHNGLLIDKSLTSGMSYPCDTFGNEILSEKNNGKMGKFKIIGLEVWQVGDLE